MRVALGRGSEAALERSSARWAVTSRQPAWQKSRTRNRHDAGTRAVLDNNIWSYLVEFDLLSELSSMIGAHDVVLVGAPSMLLETARRTHAQARAAVMRAMERLAVIRLQQAGMNCSPI